MSILKSFPNISKITKNVALMAWDMTKVYHIDMILWILTLAAIVTFAIVKDDKVIVDEITYIHEKVNLDGAAAVLFAYIFYAVYRLMGSRKIIKDQKALIDKLTSNETDSN